MSTSSTLAAPPLPSSVHQEGSRFGDTRVSGGVLVQGNVVGLTINATASARADYVGHYAYSSLRPVSTYVQRRELYKQLQRQLAGEGDGNEQYKSRILAVWGLGGMGKTQLVLDYVQSHRSEYRAIFWIEAGQKSTVERDFVNIYQLLFDVALPPGEGRDHLEGAVLRVKSWFGQRRERWLFVFDGADSVDDPDDREYINLPHFMPESSTVDIIVTSRSRTVQEVATLGGVNVGEMEPVQAAELFCKASTLTAPSFGFEEKVKCIVEELGYLALAVNLAGTYVRETPRLRSDVGRYLPEYRQRRRNLLQRKPTRLVDQYSESVLTTWETSFRAVQEQCAAAVVILTVLAFLNHDDIYLDLFGLDDEELHAEDSKNGHIDEQMVTWKTRLFPGERISLYTVEECFRVLERYCLVQWQGDQQSFGMHRLVKAWGFDRLSTTEQEIYAAASVELIGDAMSRCGTGLRNKLRLAPHVMANFGVVSSANLEGSYQEKKLKQVQAMGFFMNELGRWSDVWLIETFIFKMMGILYGDEHPDTISAMSNLARTFGDQGKLEEAAAMKQEVLLKMREILGDEHPDTISAMNNLANSLGDQGKLEEAAAIKQEVLSKRRRILGDEHPSTISAMSNLAITLRGQGKLEEAAAMMQEVLSKRRRILGDEHPDTISAMNNLANSLGDQGKLEEAAAMKQEVLSKRRRILGDEHPDTISAVNNLAITLRGQGKLEEAAAMKQEVLLKMREILGDEHPSTISAMSNLASTLGDQGKLEEAAAMKQEVLSKRRRILGDEHPSTISAMNNLANSLGDQGKLEEAAAIKQEVLSKRRRILGDEHPSTISAMSNLAITLRGQGKLEEAAAMMQEVLSKRRRILGDEHPDTISAMNNLANSLGDQGKLEEAAAMKQEVLSKRRRILGDEHPDTISAVNNLAITLRGQGKLEEAAAMKQEVLLKMREILGDEHPDTISAMNNLANSLGDQGKLEEAAAMKQEVLSKRRRILGDEHPDTISAMNNLASTLGDQGKLEEAALMFKEVVVQTKRLLSEEHPMLAMARNNLALALHRQSRLD